jgi:hypothetical protein
MKTPAQPSNRRSTTPSSAPQGGRKVVFASAAQFALVMVTVLISATAYALDTANDQVVDKTADTNALYLLKATTDLEHALNRAVADNGLRHQQVAQTVGLDGVSGSSRVGLFDPRLRYGRAPQWPKGLLVEGVEGAGSLRWADRDAQVIEVAGIDLGVCRRLNETLQGTAADRAPPADLQTARDGRGWTQGCWAEAGAEAGTWFKEVFAEVHCRGGNCRGGDVVATPTREATVTSAPPDAESVPLSPLEALTQCAAREAAAGVRDPQVVAARCTVSS